MNVGFCVEGTLDRLLVQALRDRWCPHADLVEGRYRGAFRRREIPKACFELRSKGVDVIILMRDANRENWRDVAAADLAACDVNDRHMVVVGVCDRNIECWLVADPQYASRRLGVAEADLRVGDPKGVFERAMGITRLDNKADDVIRFVVDVPLDRWLANASFKAFYDQLWLKSKELGCELQNLREAGR